MRSKQLLAFLFLTPLLLGSCTDKCEKTIVSRRTRSITLSATEIRSNLRVEAPAPLERPGKIYIKDEFLFINEIQKGIHIFDNSNPSNPRQLSFINIPGNGDLAVKDNILYADSYMDLVSLDIANPQQPQEVGRVNNAFVNGMFDGFTWIFNPQNGSVSSAEAYFAEETVATNCEGVIPYRNWWWDIIGINPIATFGYASYNSSSSAQSSGSTTGTGGSMARFTIIGDFLYTVDQQNLHLFDIATSTAPTFVKSLPLGWGIETIFPYKNALFIGTNTGMHILDNEDPTDPQLLSTYSHIRACDPVVVENDIAYVTLRTGVACGGTQNLLNLVDVSNLSSPQLIKSYTMENPAGLTIDFPNLYICEGKQGLKVFDASDKFAIDKNLLDHRKGMEAYDVISFEKRLMMIGKDGLYQFSASNPRNLTQLSHIPVKAPEIVIENSK